MELLAFRRPGLTRYVADQELESVRNSYTELLDDVFERHETFQYMIDSCVFRMLGVVVLQSEVPELPHIIARLLTCNNLQTGQATERLAFSTFAGNQPPNKICTYLRQTVEAQDSFVNRHDDDEISSRPVIIGLDEGTDLRHFMAHTQPLA